MDNISADNKHNLAFTVSQWLVGTKMQYSQSCILQSRTATHRNSVLVVLSKTGTAICSRKWLCAMFGYYHTNSAWCGVSIFVKILAIRCRF